MLLTESQFHAEEELVKPRVEYATPGKFPFVYTCIQPIENNSLNLDALMENQVILEYDSIYGSHYRKI